MRNETTSSARHGNVTAHDIGTRHRARRTAHGIEHGNGNGARHDIERTAHHAVWVRTGVRSVRLRSNIRSVGHGGRAGKNYTPPHPARTEIGSPPQGENSPTLSPPTTVITPLRSGLPGVSAEGVPHGWMRRRERSRPPRCVGGRSVPCTWIPSLRPVPDSRTAGETNRPPTERVGDTTPGTILGGVANSHHRRGTRLQRGQTPHARRARSNICQTRIRLGPPRVTTLEPEPGGRPSPTERSPPVATRDMRFWYGTRSPGENERLNRRICQAIFHPPALRPQRRKHRRPDMV